MANLPHCDLRKLQCVKSIFCSRSSPCDRSLEQSKWKNTRTSREPNRASHRLRSTLVRRRPTKSPLTASFWAANQSSCACLEESKPYAGAVSLRFGFSPCDAPPLNSCPTVNKGLGAGPGVHLTARYECLRLGRVSFLLADAPDTNVSECFHFAH